MGIDASALTKQGILLQQSGGSNMAIVGVTKAPVELVLNPGQVGETRLYPRAVITKAENYEVLVGMEVAYPIGMCIDAYEEKVWYRPEWRTGGTHKVELAGTFIRP